MKSFSVILLCIILGVFVFSAGCSTAGGEAAGQQTEKQTGTPTSAPPSTITYEKHGFGFVYPDNLVLTEYDTSEDKSVSWESGELHLKGENPDNITVNWMAMHHRPPDIPKVYESMRTSFQKDPKLSDVKFYLLETYPATTCGDATFIGHMSFTNKARKIPTNEGIILWYHPRQDRTYIIDIATGNDYNSYIRDILASYQQSFRCEDA